ncbi:AfsR/SARP family transcriptional regulator [Actinosynnema sp. ALI-1.44]|uniref:AfsR/SARP family transcriptional regulator n=1 Tax=Actinosynnema sp. ALI-1.44 TaxID=1933779 RepID=UPI001EDB4EF3|nr:BTAD domain-containing putative transcriptional regulator [Actinosynnema sp. ALI-1.44]
MLGPLKAWRDGQEIDLGWPKQQAVLAVLLLELNRPVPADKIVDRVWGERHPQHARNTVHTNISRLRRALLPEQAAESSGVVLASTDAGYLLRGDPAQLDTSAFEQHLAAGRGHYRDGELVSAAEDVDTALAMWRGEPFGGLEGPLIEAERRRLQERHLDAVELRAMINLDRGYETETVADLAGLVLQFPVRERLRELLMLALYRSGRQADALQTFHDLRETLTDTLGVDPCPALHRLYQQILVGDPALSRPSGTRATTQDAGVAGPPRQLPAAPRLFTGRRDELTALTDAVDEPADSGIAVVITAIGGTGGIGKTWLALHWAHQNVDLFPGGQLYVNLRGFDSSGEPMPPAVAVRGFLTALGVSPAAIPIDLDAQTALYRSLAAGKQLLVVLDNARDVAQVTPLLPGSRTCTVLITSRRHLAGLVATHGAQILDLDVLSDTEARELLVRHLGPDRLAAEPSSVNTLLDRCAGLPLAISIVAARIAARPDFALAALAEELQDAATRLDGLDAGELTADLRAVISWSYRVLDIDTARVFALLGLVQGPDVGLHAVASLTALPAARARIVLRELEAAHLVQQHMPDRYRMHDLVRLYAAERATHDLTTDARQEALRRFIDFYLHTAHAGESLLNPHGRPIALDHPAPGAVPRPLRNAAEALDWFDTEHICIQATQQLAVQQGWLPSVWQLAWTITNFQRRRGHFNDHIGTWQTGLAAAGQLGDPNTRALACWQLGYAFTRARRHADAFDHLRQALTLAEQTKDIYILAGTHRALACTWERRGDDQQALTHATQAVELFEGLDFPVWYAEALNVLGWFQARLGYYADARTNCEKSLALYRGNPDSDGEASTLDSLGFIASRTDLHADALDYYHRALELFTQVGNAYQEADTRDKLGDVHVALDQQAEARASWQRALSLYQAQYRIADVARIRQKLADS